MTDMLLSVAGEELKASWTGENPRTWRAVKNVLPVHGDANRRGDELYLEVPVALGEEAAYRKVPRGTVAYWPEGNALCIFWGPTPASEGEEPEAVSPVNPFGILRDTSPLERLEGTATLSIEKID